MQFLSNRQYPVTDVMIEASKVEAYLYDANVSEDQIKTLLRFGLPRSIEHLPEAIAESQIDLLAASRILVAAVTASNASRPWYAKVWRTMLCKTGRHQTEPALAHPDRAAAIAIGCELYECRYCEHVFVHEFGGGTSDFSQNTRMAEHRDRVLRKTSV